MCCIILGVFIRIASWNIFECHFFWCLSLKVIINQIPCQSYSLRSFESRPGNFHQFYKIRLNSTRLQILQFSSEFKGKSLRETNLPSYSFWKNINSYLKYSIHTYFWISILNKFILLYSSNLITDSEVYQFKIRLTLLIILINNRVCLFCLFI